MAELGAPSKKQRRSAVENPQAEGLLRVHPAGYGFVTREDDLADVFVPANYRAQAIDGDRVIVSTWASHKGTEGRVMEILQRGRCRLTGTLCQAGRVVYLQPDDPRVAIGHSRVALDGGAGRARIGHSVVVEITRYPDPHDETLMGRVTQILGEPEDPQTEIAKILICAEIPDEFPAEALAQAAQTAQEVKDSDLADRIDLRDRAFCTIDPVSARDFDDALCVEEGPEGLTRVWVAVADVSHYVRPDDALDREALTRGVSVYFPDQVVPMLPFELSSGICSLHPEVDRCAMVVRLDFDRTAQIVDTGYAAAVIRSQARLDYPGVAAALDDDFRGPRARYKKWASALSRLSVLAQALRKRRQARGALEIDIPEPKIVLDADDPRLVRDIVQSKSIAGVKGAYELVEEFMIAANEAVGRYFTSRGITTLWRVHAPPEDERLVELANILAHFSIRVPPREMTTPHGVRKVLKKIQDRPERAALSFMVLRALQQAVYDTTNIGHFGLASEDYLHFTSPIRRYPDLVVHRLLKFLLHREGQAAGQGALHKLIDNEALLEFAREASKHERRAVGAEREAISMYRALLMREHVGEDFVGHVSAVTSFGVFVELAEPFIEGLIKTKNLGDDFYDFDPLALTWNARRSGHTIGLGDEIAVKVVAASIGKRTVDFEPLSGLRNRKRAPASSKASTKQRRSGRRRKEHRTLPR